MENEDIRLAVGKVMPARRPKIVVIDKTKRAITIIDVDVIDVAVLLLLIWSPSITDDDDFLINVENMTQHEEEESMCKTSLR